MSDIFAAKKYTLIFTEYTLIFTEFEAIYFFFHPRELVLIFSFIHGLVGNSVFKRESGRGAAAKTPVLK